MKELYGKIWWYLKVCGEKAQPGSLILLVVSYSCVIKIVGLVWI